VTRPRCNNCVLVETREGRDYYFCSPDWGHTTEGYWRCDTGRWGRLVFSTGRPDHPYYSVQISERLFIDHQDEGVARIAIILASAAGKVDKTLVDRLITKASP
jgi:hypothetical protein